MPSCQPQWAGVSLAMWVSHHNFTGEQGVFSTPLAISGQQSTWYLWFPGATTEAAEPCRGLQQQKQGSWLSWGTAVPPLEEGAKVSGQFYSVRN